MSGPTSSSSCLGTAMRYAVPSVTTPLVPRGGGHTASPALQSHSHHRCRTPAAASSCRAGMGPQSWPGQQSLCNSLCGGTSWKPSAVHLGPGTLQGHGTSGHRHSAKHSSQPPFGLRPCPPHTNMGSTSVGGIALRFAPQESSIVCRVNGQDGFWPAVQPQLVVLTHCLHPMVIWGGRRWAEGDTLG